MSYYCCIARGGNAFFVRKIIKDVIEGYTTVKDISQKWGLKPRTVQIMCSEGRIPGAVKFGRDWAIPKAVSRPGDGRVVTGEYKDYRKIKEEK